MSDFDNIMEGLGEAVRHASGEDVPGMVIHVPASLNVAEIRAKTKLSQPAFANSVGVSVGTVRQWEHKRRQPDGPARVLLAMVEKRPGIVRETLGVTIEVARNMAARGVVEARTRAKSDSSSKRQAKKTA